MFESNAFGFPVPIDDENAKMGRVLVPNATQKQHSYWGLFFYRGLAAPLPPNRQARVWFDKNCHGSLPLP